MAETGANSFRLHPRHQPALAMAGVVAAYVLFNVITSWFWPDRDDGILCAMCFGVFVLEPMILGAWAALGAGSLVTRLPIAVLIFMLLLIAPAINPASFADIEQREFVVTVVAGFALLAAAMILFLGFRWATGLRIAAHDSRTQNGSASVRFSMKYLISLTTLCAVVLGIVCQIKFRTERPPILLFGPNFFISVVIVGGTTLAAGTLSILSVPLIVLHGRPSKRVVLASVAFWLLINALVAAFWTLRGEKLLETFEVIWLAQLGPALAGTLTALALRLAGIRLVRGPASGPQLRTSGTATQVL